jgi:hypothetical protein
MLTRPIVVASALVSTSLVAQGSSTPHSCAASEQALRAVAHDFWAAYNHRDAAALDKLLDDRLLYVTESGTLLSKAQVLAAFRVPEGSMKLESAEEPENLRTAFIDGVGVMSFTKAFKITHQPTGASFGTTARMTETFVCVGGEWKVVAFQETMVPNPARPVHKAAAGHFDDYVGKYRFGEDGRGGEISVTRRGNQLYESWGTDKPIEILPGKYDTFFTPGFPILERFVRDRRGRVVGVVYALGDSEVEAKRVQ